MPRLTLVFLLLVSIAQLEAIARPTDEMFEFYKEFQDAFNDQSKELCTYFDSVGQISSIISLRTSGAITNLCIAMKELAERYTIDIYVSYYQPGYAPSTQIVLGFTTFTKRGDEKAAAAKTHGDEKATVATKRGSAGTVAPSVAPTGTAADTEATTDTTSVTGKNTAAPLKTTTGTSEVWTEAFNDYLRWDNRTEKLIQIQLHYGYLG